MNSSSKKRKRKETIKIPRDIVQNESLEMVASILGPIKTLPVSAIDKDILLDRLQIELLDKYNFFLKTSSAKTEKELNLLTTEEKRSIILRRHLIVGINECTRVLENVNRQGKEEGLDADKKKLIPSLVMLARDLRPPTIVSHIPYLCKQLNIPVALLPGKASSDVGKTLRIKRASVVVFMKFNKDGSKGRSSTEKEVCNKVSSYVEFAKSKIPTSP
jgi:ribosomal protein L7Ae-like RNA K-turn-binding protein